MEIDVLKMLLGVVTLPFDKRDWLFLLIRFCLLEHFDSISRLTSKCSSSKIISGSTLILMSLLWFKSKNLDLIKLTNIELLSGKCLTSHVSFTCCSNCSSESDFSNTWVVPNLTTVGSFKNEKIIITICSSGHNWKRTFLFKLSGKALHSSFLNLVRNSLKVNHSLYPLDSHWTSGFSKVFFIKGAVGVCDEVQYRI